MKNTFRSFFPVIPSHFVQEGKGKQHVSVCTTKAQHLVLEALWLVEQPMWSQWSWASSADNCLQIIIIIRAGQTAGTTRTLCCPLKWCSYGAGVLPASALLGCDLGSARLRGVSLGACLVLCNGRRRWDGIKTLQLSSKSGLLCKIQGLVWSWRTNSELEKA